MFSGISLGTLTYKEKIGISANVDNAWMNEDEIEGWMSEIPKVISAMAEECP